MKFKSVVYFKHAIPSICKCCNQKTPDLEYEILPGRLMGIQKTTLYIPDDTCQHTKTGKVKKNPKKKFIKNVSTVYSVMVEYEDGNKRHFMGNPENFTEDKSKADSLPPIFTPRGFVEFGKSNVDATSMVANNL